MGIKKCSKTRVEVGRPVSGMGRGLGGRGMMMAGESRRLGDGKQRC